MTNAPMDATSLSADDILNLKHVAEAQIHPTEPLVAYTVASGVTKVREKQSASRVWLARTDGGAPPRPLTAEGTRAARPRWSPDGNRLAFLGNRSPEAKDQLYVIDTGWGEAIQLTDSAGGIAGFAWEPRGDHLVLLVTDPPPADEEERNERGEDQIEYEHVHRFTRLWRLDPRTKQLSQISHADAQVFEFAISPDGKRVVALIADEPYNWAWYRAHLALLDTEQGTFKELYRSQKQFTHPAWSPDGRQLAALTCTWSDQGMTGGDILLMDHDGGNAHLVTDGHARSYISISWDMSSSRLIAAAIEDGESSIGYLSLAGTFEPLWREKASVLRWGGPSFSASADSRTLAVAKSDPRSPADVWTLELASRDWTRHTTMNPTTSDLRLGKVETLHWPSFDGTTIQGLLVRPSDTPSGRLPLITLIHGGPTSLWSYEFPGIRSLGWVQLLAQAGFAVLLPNPRGSMGWGTAFAEANLRDMGGGDLADILAGVDYCVAQGVADPQRLGVAGWSYGGYMTAWAVSQTDRFKAAIAGASITNWISFHGVSTIPDFDAVFYRTDPFDWDGHYGQFSPMAHVRNVRTPTLFLHGEQDPICPVGQAYEMWRALKELGVESELIVYPREGHGMREREHARDVLERAVRWFKERV